MITSSYPWWWLALPVLLLPIWWHRQKRQRLDATPLATARFLPAAAPEQLRVWQWRDRLLLLVRCLLLISLIAWLAATVLLWRGDTVLVDAGADQAWATRQIADAGMSDARRIDLPPDALAWLRKNERDWRADARLLIVAREGQIGMTARAPQFGHAVELRVQAASVAPAAPAVQHQVVLSATSEREPAWRSLFAAFGQAGDGAQRYALATAPVAATELIVCDTPGLAPPPGWRAPHWWLRAGSDKDWPELDKATTITINGITLRYADSPRGRLWTSTAFPPRDAQTARALYQAWRLLAAAPAPAYPAPSHKFSTAAAAAVADASPAHWIAWLLLALFLLERSLTHARRA
ncbi:hypothetical protein J2X54_000587 [Duganella sp. 3397]|uniref:BatA domain-containing protein n=1 Tax=Duganella sp. 3397 TaxID=2817732 RepID=UPI00285B1960|nr:BatA domain-containing protein [Duganella sp. 3397]MDR7048152.1 hypothetical protein [Duganella sp. 3397]